MHGTSLPGPHDHLPSERVASPITIAILAAGSSVRMGAPKQLLQFEGISLLQRATHTALSAGCPVLVVVGASSVRMRVELEGEPITIVENDAWKEGVASSVRCAIQHLSPDTDAILVMTVDQPLVTRGLLEKIVKAYHATGGPLVACRYADTIGVPALYARSLFAELLTLRGDTGAKPIIEKHRGEAQLIDAPECAFDIDTPEEWASGSGGLALP
jgi:molybdenum cofactor cytidylyltransferase